MQFSELPEFSSELKRLLKKYRSLKEDLERFKPLLQATPRGNESKHWNCLHRNKRVEVYKVRLTCSYLNASTIRVIYAYRVADTAIDFIELYYKGEKENEDRERIKSYLKDAI